MPENINNNPYEIALKFAEEHYENFPVVSFLVPKELRKHVAVIYQFARTADDLADEGNDTDSIRIENLNNYESDFTEAQKGNYKNEFWKALHASILERNLTPKYFHDLLKAFKQDVEVKRYNTFEDILQYCAHSANPVGRLILELFNLGDEELNIYSDNICTALQLANFYQDVGVDFKKGRIYIPLEEMKKYGVDENVFVEKDNNVNFKELLRHQVDRTKNIFQEGRKLIQHLPYRLRLEISWTVLGGEKILSEIEKIDYDVLNVRPKLSKFDYIFLMIKSLLI